MPAIFTIFIANLAFGFIRNKKQNMRYQAHNGTNNGYGILKCRCSDRLTQNSSLKMA